MMPETLNEMLDVYGACDDGIAAIEAVVGDLSAPMPCDWAWALAVLSAPGLPTAQYVGWAIGRLVAPCAVGVVAGAYLRGADLRYADLAGANLTGANLAGADMTGADLWRAQLRGANLRGANLRGARFVDVYLRDADLQSADLRDADLCSADLRGAVLDGADLANARRGDLDPAIPGWTVVDGRLAVCDI